MASSSAFDQETYSVSTHISPLGIDPHSSVPPYDETGLSSWDPYLASISVDTIAESRFQQCYTQELPAQSMYASGLPGHAAPGRPAWSLSLQDYQQQTGGTLAFGSVDFNPYGNALGSNCGNVPLGYVSQDRDSHQIPLYDQQPPEQHPNEQERRGDQPLYYEDVVQTRHVVSPGALSNQSFSERQPPQLPQQISQQEQDPQQIPPANKVSQGKPVTGTKREPTDDGGTSKPDKRRRRGRRKTQRPPDKLAPASIDTWSPPTPHSVNQSFNTGSFAESARASSPALCQTASLVPTDDGSVGSSCEAHDGPRRMSLVDMDQDDYQGCGQLLAPPLTANSALGPLSIPTPSPSPTFALALFSRPASFPTQPTVPSSSFSSVSPATSLHNQPLRRNTESSIVASSSSTSLSSISSAAAATDAAVRRGRRASESDQKARNRVAATKCRLKTKAAISRLELEERAASERNETLGALAAQLRDEVLVLRTQLLQHTDCGCSLIQQYLGKTARLLAEAAEEREEKKVVKDEWVVAKGWCGHKRGGGRRSWERDEMEMASDEEAVGDESEDAEGEEDPDEQ